MIEGLADADLMRNQCLIGGIWTGQPEMPVIDPSTGREIARVPNLDGQAAIDAIAAASEALSEWRARTGKNRARVLRRWFDLIIAHQQDLALILTTEQGKPLSEARGEIEYAASFAEWFAEEAKRVYGEIIPSTVPGGHMLVLRQPIGVVGAITPWNFPAAMITRKVSPALAVGCTVVLKPAPETPLTALALAELACRAGVPPGVLNVITGDAVSIGEALTTSPTVRAISFTGSTEVGKLLMRQCADTVKRLALELGGNAPFIVFDDADVDAAADGAIKSKFRNNGQTCVCANRFYIQRGVAEAFTAALVRRVAALKVGDGREDGVLLGPLINEAAFAKVVRHIEGAVRCGASIVIGGKQHVRGGLFFEPTVITAVTENMAITKEETFGPVVAISLFDTEEEALGLANDTAGGLAGYFYTRDNQRIFRMAEALECGVVGVNSGLVATEAAPFGGVKESGLGREGSRHGIDDFVEIKYVLLGQ